MKKALFFGLATLDIQYFVDNFPEGNVKVKAAPPEFFVGGPATNAAVAFASLNGKANLVTAVGQNAFRDFFTTDFNTYNINFTDLLQHKQADAVLATVITATNGERNIFTHNPADLDVAIDEKKLLDTIKPELVMVDGFYPKLAVRICKEAKRRNIPVVFDGGSWKPYLPDVLPLVDYAICSNDFLPPACQTSNDVFTFLSKFKIDYKAITRGSRTILCNTKTGNKELDVIPVDVVDTLGAGDFFHGAFCYFLLKESTFYEAIEQASQFASHTCTCKGTRSWLNKLL